MAGRISTWPTTPLPQRSILIRRTAPVACHVDHVVHPAQDPEIAVSGLHGSVAGEIRPVAPVFAAGVLVVLRVVGIDEPLRLAPDGLEDTRPRVADADVARPAVRDLVAV